MSKASEWLEVWAAQDADRWRVEDARPKWDSGGLRAEVTNRRWLFMKGRESLRLQGWCSELSPEKAIEFAHWIIETFGERK